MTKRMTFLVSVEVDPTLADPIVGTTAMVRLTMHSRMGHYNPVVTHVSDLVSQIGEVYDRLWVYPMPRREAVRESCIKLLDIITQLQESS